MRRDASPRSFRGSRKSSRPPGEATVQRTDSGAVLKWRARRPANQTETARTVGAVSELDPSAVRHAAELAPVDPFQDPFGDSIAQVEDGGSFQLVPPNTQSAPKEPAPPKQPGPELPKQPGPLPRVPSETDQEQNGMPPRVPIPSDTLPEPDRFGSSDADSFRKYDGRNCPEEQESCARIRSLVNATKIDSIQLNITPAIDPEAKTAEAGAEAKRKRLAEMPTRQWKNRRGEVVATGKVINFQNRRAVIEGEDGRTVRIPFNELGRDEICFLTAWWRLPSECILSDKKRHLNEGREQWIAATYTWTASSLCHKPLYFEERALERYGHTCGPIVQPFKSAAHFFLNIAVLPYKAGMYPPNECRYALGYYRPGDCAPWMVDPIPFSLRGALFQAGAGLGVAAIIP